MKKAKGGNKMPKPNTKTGTNRKVGTSKSSGSRYANMRQPNSRIR